MNSDYFVKWPGNRIGLHFSCRDDAVTFKKGLLLVGVQEAETILNGVEGNKDKRDALIRGHRTNSWS